ncbi:MAG: right-handed parallel beta-helix repeat-containing protein [Halioglobus sp.]|nr:right-handed parallel beta-helix repeat-containing protein [Halioglobus sp.]
MSPYPLRRVFNGLALQLLSTLSLLGCSDNNSTRAVAAGDADFPNYSIVSLAPGGDLEARALEALITAQPNTIIQLPAGTYEFVGELSSSVDNIVLQGAGMDAERGTVLRFSNQVTGAQGILGTGNNFVVQDLAVEDTPGDAIKIEGTNGVTIRRVRVEWTRGPNENNGPYGLYPVQTRNVLIEDCEVRGASDAGVYVGQSENIIVRRNYVYENVAGIEIENSKFADVYDNLTTGNTGGILVFDLPGPPIQGGQSTRVYNNRIIANNEPNFAPEGNIVGTVPSGTGLMIMANDDIEAFNNIIEDNVSLAVLIVSYYFVDLNESKATYDPVPEKIFIHNNTMRNNGTDPQGDTQLIPALLGGPADIFHDSSGIGTDAGLLVEFPDGLTENQAVCIVDNDMQNLVAGANLSTLLLGVAGDVAITTDPRDFNCRHAALPAVVLEPPLDPDDPDGPLIDTDALCRAEGSGINVDALVADCPNLSDYRLFQDPADPLHNAMAGGVIYDLTTPLFSDYTNKHRFMFVPEGEQAIYRDQDVFDFPVGTVITKTFSIKADLRDKNSAETIIETRLLIHRKEGWVALPYIWDQGQTNAALTVTGGTDLIRWIDNNGEQQSTNYVIPNTNNCANCHGEDNLIPIGPKARLLNKDFDYRSGTANQLDHWSNLGILSGAPRDKRSIHTIPLEGDTSASLDDRARGYMDINCAHCHQPLIGAANTSGLFLEYYRPFGAEVGECKPPVAAGEGSGEFDYVIVPGDASTSIIDFRMDSNKPEVRMPEIGRSIIHSEGVSLLRNWINAMEVVDCSAR